MYEGMGKEKLAVKEEGQQVNNEELKAALLSGCPVEYNSLDNTRIKFKCVTAIIYRKKGSGLDISAEVKDVESKSVCIVDPKRLKEVSGNAES